MNGERFLDTNVLVYLLSDDTTKASRSEALLAQGGVISVQVLNEFTNVARNKGRASWTVINQALVAFKSALRVEPITVETHELGVKLAEQHRVSVYDGMILAAALRAGCSLVYSEDMQAGRRIADLTIRNPYA